MANVGAGIDDWCSLLADKVVFLTGGAGWLAQHIAKTCYAHGARLVLGDLDPVATNKVKDEIIGNENKEDRVLVVHLDVCDESSIEQAVKLAVDKWTTIHVLLNTAAAFNLGYVEQVSADDWSHVLDVNVRGYALMAKHITPFLKKQGSGCIINMASAAGLVAHSNFLPYSTSKAAIIQMTRNLALDLGPFNIRVNSVSPGAIDSPTLYHTAAAGGISKEQFDEAHGGKCLKRLGQPKEVANLVLFLASDLCLFMTGTNLILDGGYTTI